MAHPYFAALDRRGGDARKRRSSAVKKQRAAGALRATKRVEAVGFWAQRFKLVASSDDSVGDWWSSRALQNYPSKSTKEYSDMNFFKFFRDRRESRRLSKILLLALVLTYALRPNATQCEVTQKLQYDGFGSQFQNIISTAVFAHVTGRVFCMTPIHEMEHNYDHRKGFINEVNALMNMHTGTKRARDKAQVLGFKKDWLDEFLLSPENNTEAQEVLATLRRRFLKDKSRARRIPVAVHVRRLNAHDTRETVSYDHTVCKVMRTVARNHSKSTFHIFSQGPSSEFKMYHNDSRIILRLNEPLNVTFTEMVLANVLISATSSLSYAAALISEGQVWAPEPFWHTYPSHWNTYAVSDTINGSKCLT